MSPAATVAKSAKPRQRRRGQQWETDKVDLPPVPANLNLAILCDVFGDVSEAIQEAAKSAVEAGPGNAEATQNLQAASGIITDHWRKMRDLLAEIPVTNPAITCSHCPEAVESDRFIRLYRRYLPSAWKAIQQAHLEIKLAAKEGRKPSHRSVRQWALAAGTGAEKASYAHQSLGALNSTVSVLSRHRRDLSVVMEKLALALQAAPGIAT